MCDQGNVMNSKTFDIGEAIFFFFRRFGEKPGAAMWIILWQMGLVGALSLLAIIVIGPAYLQMFELLLSTGGKAGAGLSEAEIGRQVLQTFAPIFPVMALITPVSIIVVLMIQGAWLRFLTRGHVAAGIPFRLGGDEFRLLGVNLLYIAVGFAAYIGTVIVVIAFAAVMAGIFSMGDVSAGAGMMGGVLAFFGFLALIAAIIFFVIKLATAPALTVRDEKFRFFESWDATTGVFWNMLLSYVVVAFFSMVLAITIGTLIQFAFLGAAFPLIQQLIQMAQSPGNVAVEQVIETVLEMLRQPGVQISLGIGFAMSYLLRIVLEGMWHGVGAYNAVRHRSDGALEEGDAPVFGKDHPLGASPSEG